jgi:hypothetical protein
MLRVHQEQLLKMAFQYIPDSSPILASGFHRNLGHFAILQPGAELCEIAREGRKVPLAHSGFWLAKGRQHADRHALLVYIDAATAAILGFHNVLSISSERRLETYGDTTFLRVFIRLAAATTVPGSSERVLTRFPNGLLRAPTDKRPLDSLEIYFHLLEPVKRRPFSSVLVDARSAAWGSAIKLSALCRLYSSDVYLDAPVFQSFTRRITTDVLAHFRLRMNKMVCRFFQAGLYPLHYKGCVNRGNAIERVSRSVVGVVLPLRVCEWQESGRFMHRTVPN